MENEVNHERRVTETSRLSSSWASLRLSNDKPPDSPDGCGISSPGSTGSSPIRHQRPNSFSGPLMVSVTCSSTGIAIDCSKSSNIVNTTPNTLVYSRCASCYPSPAASPVSSRVQCYSPGMGQTACSFKKKRTHSTSSGGSASPLMLNSTLGKKRLYTCMGGGGQSSNDESRESSPDPMTCRNSKFLRSSDANNNVGSGGANTLLNSPPTDFSRWAPSVSTPSSPFLSLSNSTSFLRPSSNSPSTTSLPSPHQSLSTCIGLASSPQVMSGLQQSELGDNIRPALEVVPNFSSSCLPSQFLSSESVVNESDDETK